MNNSIFDFKTEDQPIALKPPFQLICEYFNQFDMVEPFEISDYDENFSGLIDYVSIEDQKIAYLDPDQITIAPKTFQYKICHDSKTGSTGSLKGVINWSEDLAGLILVWRSEDKIFCVNGHNRLSLAKKLNIEKIAVKFIDAKSESEARLTGALCNIAEGNGSVIDCAKIFKESDLTSEDLKSYGINLAGKLASQGLTLSKVNDHIFESVTIGKIPIKYGIYAGKLDTKDQDSFIKLCSKRDPEGNISDQVLIELTDMMLFNDQSDQTCLDMYGNKEQSDLILYRADLIAYIQGCLKQQKSIFSNVSKNKELLSKGNNDIDEITSKEISDQTSTFLDIFNQFKNVNSVISKMISDYSLELFKSKDIQRNKAILLMIKNKAVYNIQETIKEYFVTNNLVNL